MPTHAFLGKGVDRADADLHGFEQVVGDDRHHHVQFELPGLGRQRHGQVAALHVEHGHIQHFRQHRVDLAGHDARARLDGRQADFIQPGGWPGGQQAEIVGDADQGDRQGAQRGGKIGHVGHRLHALEEVVGLDRR